MTKEQTPVAVQNDDVSLNLLSDNSIMTVCNKCNIVIARFNPAQVNNNLDLCVRHLQECK